MVTTRAHNRGRRRLAAGRRPWLFPGVPRKDQRAVIEVLDRELTQPIRVSELLDRRHASPADGEERVGFEDTGRCTYRNQDGNHGRGKAHHASSPFVSGHLPRQLDQAEMRHSDVSCLTPALEISRFRTYRGLELPPVGTFGVVGRFKPARELDRRRRTKDMVFVRIDPYFGLTTAEPRLAPCTPFSATLVGIPWNRTPFGVAKRCRPMIRLRRARQSSKTRDKTTRFSGGCRRRFAQNDKLDPGSARVSTRLDQEGNHGARAIVESNGGGYGLGLPYARDMIHPA